MSEQGVLLLSKPFSTAFFVQAMHMAAAGNHRLLRARQENARLQEKIAQVRLVSRAKCCLVEHEHMTEAEAHRYIENRPWIPVVTAQKLHRKSLKIMRTWVYNIGLGKVSLLSPAHFGRGREQDRLPERIHEGL